VYGVSYLETACTPNPHIDLNNDRERPVLDISNRRELGNVSRRIGNDHYVGTAAEETVQTHEHMRSGRGGGNEESRDASRCQRLSLIDCGT
jgi:hypothetical protein